MTTGDDTTPAQWVEILIRHGADLRKAGVRRVEIGGCVAELDAESANADEELLTRLRDLEAQQAHESDDPLERPDTFGGAVPRWGNG